jgi:hypothetical protein
MPRDPGPFKVGETVLVPHTDKYYEAKVGAVRVGPICPPTYSLSTLK